MSTHQLIIMGVRIPTRVILDAATRLRLTATKAEECTTCTSIFIIMLLSIKIIFNNRNSCGFDYKPALT